VIRLSSKPGWPVTLATIAFGLLLARRGLQGGDGPHSPALYFVLAAICAAVAVRDLMQDKRP